MIDTDFNKNLHGSVKRIEEERVSTGGLSGRETKSGSSSVVTFNEYGSATERVFYDKSGKETSKTIAEYDEANQQLAERSYANDKLNTEKFFANGLLQETTSSKVDGSLWYKSHFLYDLKQRLIYAVSFNPDGTISGRQEITYDKYGNRTEEFIGNEFDKYSDVTHNVKTASDYNLQVSALGAAIKRVKFNEDDNPTLVEFCDEQRVLLKRYDISYNANKQVRMVDEYLIQAGQQHPEMRLPNALANIIFTAASIYHYAKEGDINQSLKNLTDAPLERKTIYFWTHNGLLQGKRDYIFGKLSTAVENKYGTRGELLQTILRDGDEQTINAQSNLEWKFDDQDNWTEYVLTEERHSSNFGTMNSTTKVTRRIEYYAKDVCPRLATP